MTSVNTSMEPERRVMVIFGTRPEAIKLAPIIAAVDAAPGLRAVPVVTAQHRAILDQVLALFGIEPAHDLDIIAPRQTLTDITTRALRGLEPVLQSERPDVVMVQGDTSTTFAGALAAFYADTPVVHVEAGLRTGDVRSPFPEEMNRRLTTRLAGLHLAPTPTARRALLDEGVDPQTICVTGNSVIDALRQTVGRKVPWTQDALRTIDGDPRRVLLVTAHRRESWGEGMVAIGGALADLADARPELVVVVPVHPNPAVREAIAPAVHGRDNVVLVEPLPYGEFARLMARADILLTDSGGVQEEGPSLGKPVLVMRSTTERPEAIAAGTARLVGADRPRIVHEVGRLLDDADAYEAMATVANPYGDGHAARRTVAALRWLLGSGPRPEEFAPTAP